MIPDKVLYTDGHDVMVTDSTFHVKKQEYRLNGITRCAMMVQQPKRAPGIVLVLLGLGLAAMGFLGVFKPDMFPDVRIDNADYTMNTLALWGGGFFVIIGMIWLAVIREKYAVRIATAEGEKDAVVSTQKEYVFQIVEAINNAFSFVRTKTTSRYSPLKSGL